ncbi:hypothetical protein F4859DRAFT_519999 [Xylaria cf. heliscus]|nr:hypothetical protein F4859DRAFT_519999 [Xylaria cf. heliscus]
MLSRAKETLPISGDFLDKVADGLGLADFGRSHALLYRLWVRPGLALWVRRTYNIATAIGLVRHGRWIKSVVTMARAKALLEAYDIETEVGNEVETEHGTDGREKYQHGKEGSDEEDSEEEEEGEEGEQEVEQDGEEEEEEDDDNSDLGCNLSRLRVNGDGTSADKTEMFDSGFDKNMHDVAGALRVCFEAEKDQSIPANVPGARIAKAQCKEAARLLEEILVLAEYHVQKAQKGNKQQMRLKDNMKILS